MKTKITYPENAKKAKAFIVVGLILIQASLTATDSSDVKKDFNSTNASYIAGTEIPNVLNAVNINRYFNDEAIEAELEIEDWMSNIQNDDNNAYSEKEYELEEWMCNTHHSFWNDIYKTEEPEMAIENWMTSPNDWLLVIDEIILSSK